MLLDNTTEHKWSCQPIQELYEKFSLLNEKLTPSSPFKIFDDAPWHKTSIPDLLASIRDYFVINERTLLEKSEKETFTIDIKLFENTIAQIWTHIERLPTRKSLVIRHSIKHLA